MARKVKKSKQTIAREKKQADEEAEKERKRSIKRHNDALIGFAGLSSETQLNTFEECAML